MAKPIQQIIREMEAQNVSSNLIQELLDAKVQAMGGSKHDKEPRSTGPAWSNSGHDRSMCENFFSTAYERMKQEILCPDCLAKGRMRWERETGDLIKQSLKEIDSVCQRCHDRLWISPMHESRAVKS